MNLIIPIAHDIDQKSNVRPNWLWVHPNGNLMVTESVRGLNLANIDQVYIALLKKHVDTYDCLEGLRKQLIDNGVPSSKLKFVILNKPTVSQPETVAQVIKRESIEGPIFIKDADNFFPFKIKPGNYVTVADLNIEQISDPSSKSYVSYDDNGLILNIVEKKIISNKFCSGGYGFNSAQEFLLYFKKIKHKRNLYLSHVIYSMLLDNHVFMIRDIEGFLDWGNQIDWQHFRSLHATLFIDLDGTLVKNSGEHIPPFWGSTGGLPSNIKTLNRLYETNMVQIIITTSRKTSSKKATLIQLKKLGIKYHQILFNMLHAKRILINDFSDSNPYKSCDAINISRDSDQLSIFLAQYLNT